MTDDPMTDDPMTDDPMTDDPMTQVTDAHLQIRRQIVEAVRVKGGGSALQQSHGDGTIPAKSLICRFHILNVISRSVQLRGER